MFVIMIDVSSYVDALREIRVALIAVEHFVYARLYPTFLRGCVQAALPLEVGRCSSR